MCNKQEPRHFTLQSELTLSLSEILAGGVLLVCWHTDICFCFIIIIIITSCSNFFPIRDQRVYSHGSGSMVCITNNYMPSVNLLSWKERKWKSHTFSEVQWNGLLFLTVAKLSQNQLHFYLILSPSQSNRVFFFPRPVKTTSAVTSF